MPVHGIFLAIPGTFAHTFYFTKNTRTGILSASLKLPNQDSRIMLELLGLFVLLLLGWLWYDSLEAREAAVRASRRACEAEGLLFLDDTVGIVSLKPARDTEGRLKLQRAYDFEYSDTGNNRRQGSVVMLGKRVALLNVGLRAAPDVVTLH
jgi:hypothetical protein